MNMTMGLCRSAAPQGNWVERIPFEDIEFYWQNPRSHGVVLKQFRATVALRHWVLRISHGLTCMNGLNRERAAPVLSHSKGVVRIVETLASWSGFHLISMGPCVWLTGSHWRLTVLNHHTTLWYGFVAILCFTMSPTIFES